MITLVLDCAYSSCVAVLKEGKQLAFQKGEGTREADSFLQTIDNALKQAKADINDVDTICINVGPGSFTGLRVALSVAKGLGFDSKMKFSTFNSFDYIDSALPKVLEGFSSFVYIKKDGNMQCLDIGELEKGEYACLSDDMKNRLESFGKKAKLCKKRTYEELIKLSMPSKLKDIAPLYLRASQAELQRQKTQKR